MTLRSDTASQAVWTGPADGKLLNGGAACFALPPTSRCRAPAAFPGAICTPITRNFLTRYFQTSQSIDYRRKKTQPLALISHLVMQEEAAADFPLESTIVFLLDTEQWRLLVRSWKQVISSPSFVLSCPTRQARLLLASGQRQTLCCPPSASFIPSGGRRRSPAAPGLIGASSPSSQTTVLKNSHNFPSLASGATIISAFAGKTIR